MNLLLLMEKKEKKRICTFSFVRLSAGQCFFFFYGQQRICMFPNLPRFSPIFFSFFVVVGGTMKIEELAQNE